MYIKSPLIVVSALSCLLTACGGGSDSSPTEITTRSVFTETSELQTGGDTCPNGGVSIDLGLDNNGNGVLDADEITETRIVCHGADGSDGTDGTNGQDGDPGQDGADGADGADGEDGTSALLNIAAEPAGSNCANGGLLVEAGLDLNQNSMLEEDEVTSSEYVCHGLDGADGSDGAPGQDGVDGSDGADGSNGSNGSDGADGTDGAPGEDGENANDLLSVSDATLAEADSVLTFTVNMREAQAVDKTFTYGTVNVTATSGSDYQATAGKLTFLAGETTKTIDVNLLDDSTYECDEYFLLQLSGGTTVSAFGIISQDLDINEVNFAESTYFVNEDAGTASLELQLTQATCEELTLPLSFSSSDATEDDDYVTADAVFAAGATSTTVNITIVDDSLAEERETINVSIDDLTTYVGGGTDSTDLVIMPVAKTLEGGSYGTCVTSQDGLTKCFGYGDNNTFFHLNDQELGDEHEEMGENLDAAQFGSQVPLQVSVGEYISCALFPGNVVKCVGYSNNFGVDTATWGSTYGDSAAELGDNMNAIDLGSGFTTIQVEVGNDHACALSEEGEVKCWGSNSNGRLGHEATGDIGDAGGAEMGDALTAIDLGTGVKAEQLSVGYLNACVVVTGGHVKCWGSNSYGQLGLGDSNHRGDGKDELNVDLAPGVSEMGDDLPNVDLGTGRTAKKVFSGYRKTCAILDNDDLKCWGRNFDGALGQGSELNLGDDDDEMGDDLLPIELGTGLYAVDVSIGFYIVCALLNNDQVKCWGDGGYIADGTDHDIGDGKDEFGVDLVDPLSEMGDALASLDFGTGLSVKAISGNGSQTCVLLSDDTVKCFGEGEYSVLGQPDWYEDYLGDEESETGDNLPVVNLY
ncbi:Calx-beta domain-containing protein [Corallincola platygyrae]|uniref:Calx-beta domain-containing protein n=1 Tax=Corallincola platygyrae TaxID=1193278 RepID=A0ABW4XK61_9GAMM